METEKFVRKFSKLIFVVIPVDYFNLVSAQNEKSHQIKGRTLSYSVRWNSIYDKSTLVESVLCGNIRMYSSVRLYSVRSYIERIIETSFLLHVHHAPSIILSSL